MGIGSISDEEIVQAGDELHSLITLIPVAGWRRVLTAKARVRGSRQLRQVALPGSMP